MKTHCFLTAIAIALMFASCANEDPVYTEANPVADPYELFTFEKKVTIVDSESGSEVQLKIKATTQEALDNYDPDTYQLFPEFELIEKEAESTEYNNGNPPRYGEPAISSSIVIEVLESNLVEDAHSFRIQPKGMPYDFAVKTMGEPYSYTVNGPYLGAWCLSGKMYSYFYVDNTYTYSIFLEPSHAVYGLDYDAPYNQRIDLYMFSGPAHMLMYDGRRFDDLYFN